jgi:hypothetical protein
MIKSARIYIKNCIYLVLLASLSVSTGLFAEQAPLIQKPEFYLKSVKAQITQIEKNLHRSAARSAGKNKRFTQKKIKQRQELTRDLKELRQELVMWQEVVEAEKKRNAEFKMKYHDESDSDVRQKKPEEPKIDVVVEEYRPTEKFSPAPKELSQAVVSSKLKRKFTIMNYIRQSLSKFDKKFLNTKNKGSAKCETCHFDNVGVATQPETEAKRNVPHITEKAEYLDANECRDVKVTVDAGGKKLPLTRSNGYLQNQIKNLFKKEDYSFRPVTSENDIAHECVKRAQENVSGNYFGQCSDPNGEPNFSPLIVRPCLSKEYINLVYNSFIDVMDCFGVPQKAIFPLIRRESGFNINAFNAQSGGGLGQFSSVAIKEINNKMFTDTDKSGKFRRDIGGYSRPVYFKNLFNENTAKYKNKKAEARCAALEKKLGHFKPVSSAPAHRCELISLPQNPTKNFIYIAITYRLNREGIEKFIDDPKNGIKGQTLRNILLPKMNALQVEQLIKNLSLLCHNAGPGSVNVVLRTFLQKHPNWSARDFDFKGDVQIVNRKKAQIPEVVSVGPFLSYVRKEIGVGTLVGSDALTRRKIISEYVPKMLYEANEIDKSIARDYNLSKATQTDVKKNEVDGKICFDSSL